VAPGKMGGHRKHVLEPRRGFIVERLKETPAPELHTLKEELAARGVFVSHNAVWQFLRREGLRFKKRCSRRRRRWKARQASLDPRRLVFIDETEVRAMSLTISVRS
jgi:transposase